MFYLLLLGHVADVDRPLVELGHHEDRRHRLLLSVSDDGHLLGPLLKVLHTETEFSLEREITQNLSQSLLHLTEN